MNKIQTQLPVTNRALQLDRNYIANENGDMVNAHGEVCGSVDYETGKVKLKMTQHRLPELTEDTAHIERIGDAISTNPSTGKPYFERKEISGEWVAGEVTEIPSGEWSGDE